jgi:hypothetical protein
MSDPAFVDLRLVDGDLDYGTDGDVGVVTDGKCVAQDVATAFSTVPGRLFWAPKAGSQIPLYLNSDGIDAQALESEAEDVLLGDERIQADTVVVSAVVTTDGSDQSGAVTSQFEVLGDLQTVTMETDE